MKQRERRKTKAEKGKDKKKEEETLKHEKPPPFRWGVILANFCYKIGEKTPFLTLICPSTEV